MLNGFRDRLGLTKHNHPIDQLTVGASLLSGVALYPQLFKVFATKDVAGLSPATFFILTITNAIWIAYGVHRKSLPLLISGVLNLIASGTILAMYFAFGDGLGG
jgi:MtN3 and saliva related transmembrane protein